MAKTNGSKTFVFKYIIPEDSRDLYVNGAWGGVTPRNEIHMHLFSERSAIPEKITHKINPNGSLAPDGQPEYGGDFVRLIQASVVMDLKSAISIRKWLEDKIEFLRNRDETKEKDKDDEPSNT